MSEYNLGPLPWSEQTLQKAYTRGFVEAYKNIKEHPGYDLHERLSSIKSVLRLLNRAAHSFSSTLDEFHKAVHEQSLFDRNRRHELCAFEDKFQEILYLFASAAMTLVDQSRALSTKIELPGYAERVSSSFAKNPRHRFVQELRNDLIHITLHQPGWRLTTERDRTRTTRFMLYPNQLRRSDDWHSLARQYLQQHSKGVDLGALVQGYGVEVNRFQEWLYELVTAIAGDAINDYLRCERVLKALSSRFWWRLLLSQIVIPAGRDPYQYLDRYLTAAEIDEIGRLPFRSKEQVDRIIEIVDEYGACDAELRSLVYNAFGV